MEYINALLKLSHIENTISITGLNANLIDAWSNLRHRLEITGVFTTLYGSQFKSGLAPRVVWKLAKITP